MRTFDFAQRRAVGWPVREYATTRHVHKAQRILLLRIIQGISDQSKDNATVDNDCKEPQTLVEHTSRIKSTGVPS